MRTVPEWTIQIAWWLSGICATGALWYFLSTKSLVPAYISGLGGITFAVAAVILHRLKDRLAASNTTDPGGVRTLTGDVNLENLDRTRIEVIYPKPFVARPNLVVESIRGTIKIAIVEERPDGFVLKGGSAGWSTDGLWIRWTAKGTLERT